MLGKVTAQKEIIEFGSVGEQKCICSCREHVAHKAILWCSDYQVCRPLTCGRNENQSLKENASVKILWTKFFVLNTQGIALSVLSGGQAQSKWIPLIKLSKSLRRHQDAHLSTKINGCVRDHKCKGVHVIRKSPLSFNFGSPKTQTGSHIILLLRWNRLFHGMEVSRSGIMTTWSPSK